MKMRTPIADQIRTSSMAYADNAPILAVSYSRTPRSGEVITSQKCGATIAVSATGGAGSKLRVTVAEKVFNEKGEAQSDVTTNIDGAVALTLGGLIDALNALPGITAWALDAPHSLSVDSNTWTALSATQISESPSYLSCLKRSVVTTHPVYKRIGEPTVRDAGRIRITNIEVAITSETGGYVEIGRDDKVEGYVAHRRYTLTDAAVDRFGNYTIEDAPTFQGPVLVTISAANLTGAVGRVEHINATY